MRLYINTKEVPYLKQAIKAEKDKAFYNRMHGTFHVLSNILERIEICEELQKAERKAKSELKEIHVTLDFEQDGETE